MIVIDFRYFAGYVRNIGKELNMVLIANSGRRRIGAVYNIENTDIKNTKDYPNNSG